MINSPKARFRGGAVLLWVLAAALIFAGTLLGGQAKKSQRLAEFDPCPAEPNSPACLKHRINQLEMQLAELQKSVEHLQQTVKSVTNSIGDPDTGKADGFDDIWSAITSLRREVNSLKR